MSDIPIINSVLKWKFGIQVPSLAYAAKVNSRQVIFAVDISYQLIILWYEYMTAKKVNHQSTEAGTTGNEDSCPTIRSEVNQSLRLITSKVKSAYSKAK